MSKCVGSSGSTRKGLRLAPLLVAFLLVGALGPTRFVRAGEVVEAFDDGSPRLKYVTNDQGQKDGKYTEFHRNGKVAVEATYRADQLEGAWASYFEGGKVRVRTSYKGGKKNGHYEEFAENGETLVTSNYADDQLNGKVEVFRGRKVASSQTWRNGELVGLDGVVAHPVALDSIRKTVASILAGEPAVKAPAKGKAKPRKPDESTAPATGPLAEKRMGALRRLKAYRFLCGVPYEDVRLGDEPDAYAQAASELCLKLGRIDHEPPNPGLPEEQFRFAAKGTKSCNLDVNGAIGSVDDYFNDSDPSNEKRVGHRRWCLNPAMVVTGFGEAGEADPAGGEKRPYSAMWAMDESRGRVPDYEAVCYPTRGWMPIDHFGTNRAWSVSPNPVRFPNLAPETKVEVRVYRLGADFVRPEKPLDLDLLAVDTGVGSGPCVIFRPKGLEIAEGDAFWVEIFGLDAKALKPGERPKKSPDPSIRYFVHFCGPVRPPPADAADDESK